MAAVGVDIDGVIAPNPWKIRHWLFSGKPIRLRPVRVFLTFPSYVFRRPNPEAIDWILKEQAKGNRVLLISGIYAIAGPLVLLWLKVWRFPFNGIYLRQDWRDSQPKYKARIVSETGCKLFIDDREDVIAAIARQYLVDGFKEVRIFQNELGYVVSAGDNNKQQ